MLLENLPKLRHPQPQYHDEVGEDEDYEDGEFYDSDDELLVEGGGCSPRHVKDEGVVQDEEEIAQEELGQDETGTQGFVGDAGVQVRLGVH